jgi:hypothetical protein
MMLQTMNGTQTLAKQFEERKKQYLEDRETSSSSRELRCGMLLACCSTTLHISGDGHARAQRTLKNPTIANAMSMLGESLTSCSCLSKVANVRLQPTAIASGQQG